LRDENDKRAFYLGWGNKSAKYVDWVFENGYNLSIRGGNIGIGITRPQTNIHVKGSSQRHNDRGVQQDNNWWRIIRTGISFEANGKVYEFVIDGRKYEDKELEVGEVLFRAYGDKVPVGVMRIK
jgi:hypothetical protein